MSKQMPSWLEQLFTHAFDERSDSENPSRVFAALPVVLRHTSSTTDSKQMPSWLEQLFTHAFDERSDSENPKGFRCSARSPRSLPK